MELENVEKALEDIAEDSDVSVDEIRALICGSLEKSKIVGPKLKDLTSLKSREAFIIKRILMKAALRAYEEIQKADKKKARESGDWTRAYQSKVAHRAWDITTLLRRYAALRGKDPEVHSLDKWAGQESY